MNTIMLQGSNDIFNYIISLSHYRLNQHGTYCQGLYGNICSLQCQPILLVFPDVSFGIGIFIDNRSFFTDKVYKDLEHNFKTYSNLTSTSNI